MPSTALPPLVGLIGRKRSGKDTFARALPGFVPLALADPLRAAALRLDPIVGPASIPGPHGAPAKGGPGYHRLSTVIERLGWEVAKDLVPGVRETLQRLGTETIREIDPDFWTRIAADAITKIREGADHVPGQPVVVTDVRFPNEARMIEALGGVTVRITRPDHGPGEDTHRSETELDRWPAWMLVDNTGTVADLEAAAKLVAHHVPAGAPWRSRNYFAQLEASLALR